MDVNCIHQHPHLLPPDFTIRVCKPHYFGPLGALAEPWHACRLPAAKTSRRPQSSTDSRSAPRLLCSQRRGRLPDGRNLHMKWGISLGGRAGGEAFSHQGPDACAARLGCQSPLGDVLLSVGPFEIRVLFVLIFTLAGVARHEALLAWI